MRSTYKKLGPYVRELKVRNSDGACADLRGVSIWKEFMPSVANVHGTDLSKYKRVENHQFAFNPMHVGRDEALPIALLAEDAPVIVSPAYVVFEIRDKNVLLPEYLMMWCRRPEFDRNAWFTTDNSVRGGFSWNNFCEMELPIPSIEKQREIVKEYQTVVDRIRLNERLNEKLEEAAQAIYKQWFVEFEFPMTAEYAESIGQPKLAGQPYKSSGGEMEYNEVLEQDIPKGWADARISNIAYVSSGKAPVSRTSERNSSYRVPIVGAGSVMGYSNKSLVDGRVLIIGRVGTHGVVQRFKGPTWPTDNTLVFETAAFEYLFHILKYLNYDELNRGGVQGLITQTDLKNAVIISPPSNVQNDFERYAGVLLSCFDLNGELSIRLDDLRRVLLSRLAKQ